MAFMRRKRLPDGSFGELEKVGEGDSPEEIIARLTAENVDLRDGTLMAFLAIAEIFEILEGGV